MTAKHFEHESLRDFFDSRYARGDEVIAKKKLYALDLLKEMYPEGERKDCSVLDLGCGTGVITAMIAGAGFAVEGMDLSPSAIQKLEQRGLRGRVGNFGETFPWRDSSFSVLWAGDILELLPDPFLFFHEVHRVLKRDGIFVFSAPHLAWLPFRLAALLGKSSSDLMPPSHSRFWTKNGLHRFVKRPWFQMEFLGGIAPFPLPAAKVEFRLRSCNMLCRDLVGIARRLEP